MSATSPTVSNEPGTRPRTLTDQLESVIDNWATSQYELVTLAAAFAKSPEWILTGAPTPAHWLAASADVQPCTAREWIRIGKHLTQLPAIDTALRTREISYSKARTLTRLATPENETELLNIAKTTTAANLTQALAAWLHKTKAPEDIAAYQHQQRSVKWRTEPDGMITFTLRLPPLLAGLLITILTTYIMTTRPRPTNNTPGSSNADGWPTAAQQHADAIEHLLTNGCSTINTEVIIHLKGDGNALNDGTPIDDHTVAKLIPTSFIRALIVGSQNNPIDATNRRRHPTTRQKRVVDARDNHQCVDCGRTNLLNYDHNPAHHQTGHTLTTELELRCAPCHHNRSNKEADRHVG